MARPQVADGEAGLQIWTAAANILNKQQRAAENWWSSILEVGCGANNFSPLKINLLRKDLGLGRILLRLNSDNACYRSAQNLMSSPLLMVRACSMIVYRILVAKPAGNRSLGRLRSK
jgi:hypothetical protein